jgi:hypothetical protein
MRPFITIYLVHICIDLGVWMGADTYVFVSVLYIHLPYLVYISEVWVR